MIEKICARLREKFKYNSEQAEIYRKGSDTDAYFREKKELYLDRANTYGEAIRIVQEVAKDGGWIPCSERLPEERDYDDGYVEPSEPVLVFTKYNECRVSRYWGNRRNKRDYYDWVDIKHSTHEVIAWQPLPAPYQKGE